HEDPDVRFLPEPDRPIVAKALAKDPEQRFPSCKDFIVALKKARLIQRTNDKAAPELVAAGKGARAKTMAESMEDIQLSPWDESEAAIDFDKPVRAQAAEKSGLEVSDLGVTILQPETGALRPTLIIGVGSFGRKALLELRCRFIDRFGDLAKLPLVHFLCI